MSEVARSVDRMLMVLRTKIRDRGYTQLQVQDCLGWGRSYISQLVTRQKALRVEQVVLILKVIGLRPEEFYGDLYHWPIRYPARPADGGRPARRLVRQDADPEVDRLLELLANKISERGLTQIEVQRRLGWGRSYISQLLAKNKSVRVDQVLSILAVLEIEPGEFFLELYSPADYQARQRLTGSEHRSVESQLAELRSMVRYLSRLLLQTGSVSESELPPELRAFLWRS